MSPVTDFPRQAHRGDPNAYMIVQDNLNRLKKTVDTLSGGGGGGVVTGISDTATLDLVLSGGGVLSGNVLDAPTLDGLDSTAFPILGPTASTRNVVQPTGPSIIPWILKGAASQAGDLTQWQKSDTTVMTRVDSVGSVVIGVGGGTAVLKQKSGAAVTSSSGGIVTAAGTEIARFTQYGDFILGANSNNLNSGSWSSVVNWLHPIDVAYVAKDRRFYMRSIGFMEIADPVDIGIWKSGDNSGWPDGALIGVLNGEAIGAIYWAPGMSATPGGAMNEWGSRGKATVNISVKMREDATSVSGVQASGGELLIGTFPTQADMTTYGAIWPSDVGNTHDISDFLHLALDHKGSLGLYGFKGNPDLSSVGPGDFITQGDIYPGGYDDGVGGAANGYLHWKSFRSQTTIGAAGTAANLPTKPVGYAQVKVNGTIRAIPYYNVS